MFLYTLVDILVYLQLISILVNPCKLHLRLYMPQYIDYVICFEAMFNAIQLRKETLQWMYIIHIQNISIMKESHNV